jgi:hypothetical protein
LKHVDLTVNLAIEGSSSTSLWTLQNPLIVAVATPPISIYYAIVDPTALSAVLPDLQDLCEAATGKRVRLGAKGYLGSRD